MDPRRPCCGLPLIIGLLEMSLKPLPGFDDPIDAREGVRRSRGLTQVCDKPALPSSNSEASPFLRAPLLEPFTRE